jgi:hypothetical protein
MKRLVKNQNKNKNNDNCNTGTRGEQKQKQTLTGTKNSDPSASASSSLCVDLSDSSFCASSSLSCSSSSFDSSASPSQPSLYPPSLSSPLRPLSCLHPIPSEHRQDDLFNSFLPNVHFPSDHLPVGALFSWNYAAQIISHQAETMQAPIQEKSPSS